MLTKKLILLGLIKNAFVMEITNHDHLAEFQSMIDFSFNIKTSDYSFRAFFQVKRLYLYRHKIVLISLIWILVACSPSSIQPSQPLLIPLQPSLSKASVVPKAELSPPSRAPVNASTQPLSPTSDVQVPQTQLKPLLTTSHPINTPIYETGIVTGGGGGNGGGASITEIILPIPLATVPPLRQPVLDDVLLRDGESIQMPLGTDDIQANYFGKSIHLNLKGYFFDPPTDTVRAYLDNTIALRIVQVSNQVISVDVDTAYLPDLYLVGSSHMLTLHVGDQVFKVNVRVGQPEIRVNLTPTIQTVEVLKNVSQQPVQLKVTGSHFTQNPNFSYCKLDDVRAEIVSSQIVNGQSVMVLKIPDSVAFSAQNSHRLSYETPFGLALKLF